MNIFIDGSHTFRTSRNTGIERVVRMLALHMTNLKQVKDLNAEKVIHHEGRFIRLNDQLCNALQKLQSFEKDPNKMVPQFAKWGIEKATSIPPLSPLRRVLLPEPSHLGIYKLPYNLLTNAALRRWGREDNVVKWSPGDVLFMPDAYWTKRDIWNSVTRARLEGVRIVSILYDIIPITHPQFVAGRRTDKFTFYLENLLRYSDSILAISKTVRDEVRQYVSNSPGWMDFDLNKISHFELGADFSHKSGEIRAEVSDYFNKRHPNSRPYIVVGSLDPRKNHIQTIEAFERLANEGAPRSLCFIGRSVGMSLDLQKRMSESTLKPELLKHFKDMTDVELQYAYRNAEAVIMPSEVEGFGLPIVEALWHEAKVIASDTPVHREVGGERCHYFKLFDSQDLAKTILRSESHQLRCSEPFRPVSWGTSAMQVINQCQISNCNQV